MAAGIEPNLVVILAELATHGIDVAVVEGAVHFIGDMSKVPATLQQEVDDNWRHLVTIVQFSQRGRL